ncbi:orotate phosphoribosyltransferase [Christiangramia fulva]|uniref:Orotate phosphoribosyltransferase n=1 Tax=Christiangramia fulva TaxID=2126553 RepID=A0A2R3ZAI5_9FLAO|nr:orotate phosphoribosyltransferase [Christiangramia fulva]AVR47286.1 orotate phosphoribosyltransferase [Christiangramia fulva]
MKLESPKVKTSKSQEEMFEFLTNVHNYEQLMPTSKENFEAISNDTFLFQLKGMPEIRLKITETKKPELVVLGSTSDKFPFHLNIFISGSGVNESEVFMNFEGNFNPMMSMMIKKPLQKFIDTLSENAAKL